MPANSASATSSAARRCVSRRSRAPSNSESCAVSLEPRSDGRLVHSIQKTAPKKYWDALRPDFDVAAKVRLSVEPVRRPHLR